MIPISLISASNSCASTIRSNYRTGSSLTSGYGGIIVSTEYYRLGTIVQKTDLEANVNEGDSQTGPIGARSITNFRTSITLEASGSPSTLVVDFKLWLYNTTSTNISNLNVTDKTVAGTLTSKTLNRFSNVIDIPTTFTWDGSSNIGAILSYVVNSTSGTPTSTSFDYLSSVGDNYRTGIATSDSDDITGTSATKTAKIILTFTC